MMFEYKCATCGWRDLSLVRADRLDRACERCADAGPLRRVFSVAVQRPMHAHWNPTTNSVVSSNRQFDDELKRLSAERSEQTGIEHRFVRHDPADWRSLNVTSEGLDDSNRVRREQGMPELPTPQ